MGAAYYIYSDIIDYFDYDVVTLIESKYDQPTQFPTVTFCSLKKNIYDSWYPLALPTFIAFKNEYYYKGIDSANHFESFYTVQYGKCFRFNSGKNMTNHTIPIKNSTYGGQLDSFNLLVYAPEGLAVWVHNRTSPPKIELNNGGPLNDPIRISPGLFNNIAIERIEESKLEEPYNPCLKDVTTFTKNKTIIDYFLTRNESYSQEKCLDLCFEVYYVNEKPCKCNHTDLGNVWNICAFSLFEITEIVLEIIFVMCGKSFEHDFEINKCKEETAVSRLKDQFDEMHVQLAKHELLIDSLCIENNRRIQKSSTDL